MPGDVRRVHDPASRCALKSGAVMRKTMHHASFNLSNRADQRIGIAVCKNSSDGFPRTVVRQVVAVMFLASKPCSKWFITMKDWTAGRRARNE
jgi:hypothetical protein